MQYQQNLFFFPLAASKAIHSFNQLKPIKKEIKFVKNLFLEIFTVNRHFNHFYYNLNQNSKTKMETLSQLREKYDRLLSETENIPNQANSKAQQLKQLLRQGRNQARQLDQMYLQQTTTFSKVIETQERALSIQQSQQKRASDWNYIRAQHIVLQKQRQKHLKKTLELLQISQQRVSQNINQFQQQSKKASMAEVQFKVQQANQIKNNRNKFTNLTNRSKRKGVETDLDHRVIKVTVDIKEEQGIDMGERAEYLIRYNNEQARFLPDKEYSPPIMKVIMDYNFHKSLTQLENDLAKISKS